MSDTPLTAADLDARMAAILPEKYQDAPDAVRPTPMGSAPMRIDPEGRPAWNEMWASFCDLALAGGPPHKGALLEPGTAAAIAADPTRYDAVVAEIGRGIQLVTGLETLRAPVDGWVRVRCADATMAAWLLRAITTENVAVRGEGQTIDVPAAPAFRVDREIKNVITVVAKTVHHWRGHAGAARQAALRDLLSHLDAQAPLLQPALVAGDGDADACRLVAARIALPIAQGCGLLVTGFQYANWVGVDCPTLPMALWMMRALVAGNVLARREGRTLFLPLDPVADPDGVRASAAFHDSWSLLLHRRAR